VETVMTKVNKLGKGIILMHDFRSTAEALPTLLGRLKAATTRSCRRIRGADRDLPSHEPSELAARPLVSVP
jgi:hypothetical protein